jgi:SNF2 family DNA or RNA helicase
MKTLSPQSIALYKLKKQGISLYPYQKKGLNWLLHREKNSVGGLLCDEMGLGKTIQMISLILASKLKNTLLILPASLLLQWKTQLEKFSDYIKVHLYHGTHTMRTIPIFNDNKNVVITSYNLVINDVNKLSEVEWDRIILDECHYIRNPKSVIFNKLMLLNPAKKWGITGTPIQNYLSDLEVLFRFLNYEKDYIKLYIENLITKHIIRRTKQDVIHEHNELDLPPLSIKNIQFNIKEKKELDLQQDITRQGLNPLELILRKKQLSVSPQIYLNGMARKFRKPLKKWNKKNLKFDFIIKRIREQSADNRIIVFTTFNYEIEYLSQKLKTLNINVSYINGRVPNETRKTIMEDDNIQVLLVQIDCGGTGLNLQKYNIAYFTSPPWNPSLEDQAIARLYRIGQKKEVHIYRIIINKTIDKYINHVQKVKRKLIRKYIKY